MRMEHETKPRRKESTGRSASYDATIRHIEKMKAKGLYRRIMQIDPSTYELISIFMSSHNIDNNSDAVIEIIRRHKEMGSPISDESVSWFKSDEGEKTIFTTFSNDDDFEYLKFIGRKSGLRKSAVQGLAVIVREVSA